MYSENYTTFMKEFNEDLNNGKTMYSWTNRIGKDVDSSLLIYRFNVIPIQIPKVFYRYIKDYSKIYMERQSN